MKRRANEEHLGGQYKFIFWFQSTGCVCLKSLGLKMMVRAEGVEPTRYKVPGDFEPPASASSAMPALEIFKLYLMPARWRGRLFFAAISFAHDVDSSSVDDVLDVGSVILLDHFDACTAVLGDLVDVGSLH